MTERKEFVIRYYYKYSLHYVNKYIQLQIQKIEK